MRYVVFFINNRFVAYGTQEHNYKQQKKSNENVQLMTKLILIKTKYNYRVSLKYKSPLCTAPRRTPYPLIYPSFFSFLQQLFVPV